MTTPKNRGEQGFAGSEGVVVWKNKQGTQLKSALTRLSHFQVVFELHPLDATFRFSDRLDGLRIKIHRKPVFIGTAIVTHVINSGKGLVCTADLTGKWLYHQVTLPIRPEEVRGSFDGFVQLWQRNYHISSEFKKVVADMKSFLDEFRLWLEQVESGLRTQPSIPGHNHEQELDHLMGPCVAPYLTALFEKFENAAKAVPEQHQPAHRSYCRKELLPLLLNSPFMNRIYTKPLGFAGDFEMVKMILRPDPYEGPSLFARMLNGFILGAPPAVAHRNRVEWLTRRLVEETNRVSQYQRRARILNIGCGPAGEVQAFLRDHPLADQAELHLLDFSADALADTAATLEEICDKYGRHTSIKCQLKDVHDLQGESGTRLVEGKFDLIYCAGLFDYLQDDLCEKIVAHFYKLIQPGGLVVVTNVDTYNPIKNIMEFLYEWHLVYRTGAQLASLAPSGIPPDSFRVSAEPTSTNIFLEIRKPKESS